MKQTNYMLIFAGPFALLAGWFLASLPRRVFLPLAALVAFGSTVLAALEQQAVTVVTANSKAAYAFLRDHPNAYMLGSTNNVRATNFFSTMENRREMRERILSFGDKMNIENSGSAVDLATRTAGKDVFAVVDIQSIAWTNQPGEIRGLSDVPKCWMPAGTLTPATLGSGHWIALGLATAANLLPDGLQQRFKFALQPVLIPAPAYLFKVDSVCLAKRPD